ncbi:MAG TPA: glycosyltransferase family 39 protein, partial [Roseiflexaceae bacterium]|nr:glycosyltransferase family 39 protein [Roseiflexaceae bacterium]
MGSDSLPTAQSKPALIARPQSRVRQFASLFDRPAVVYAALVAVLVVAALFRLNNIAWDSGKTQHPDERFLFSVTNDLQWPESFDTYFDPQNSTLSPYSLPNMGLYVYGMLPVYLVKWVAIALDSNNYDAIQPIGRVASALFDVGSVVFLFLVGKRLYSPKVGLLAALLLSLSVLNIQLSHFYTVDTFANLFVVATLYMVVRASASGRWLEYALAGVLLGLGLSSKISVATLGVPIVLGAALDLRRRILSGEDVARAAEQVLVRLVSLA